MSGQRSSNLNATTFLLTLVASLLLPAVSTIVRVSTMTIRPIRTWMALEMRVIRRTQSLRTVRVRIVRLLESEHQHPPIISKIMYVEKAYL